MNDKERQRIEDKKLVAWETAHDSAVKEAKENERRREADVKAAEKADKENSRAMNRSDT